MDLKAGILRRMDFVRDQEGIMKRFLAERSGWKDHLDHSKRFIEGSFSGSVVSSVSVLGSGWLLDVPMEALLERFSIVRLVDIRHPVQVLKKWQGTAGVEFLQADLSGGAIRQVWEFYRKGRERSLTSLLEDLRLKEPLMAGQGEAFVSLNLLSQLDGILVDFLRKKGYTDEAVLKDLRIRIQSFHIQWITSRPACLISDERELYRDRQGRESSVDLLSIPWPEGIRNDQWIWEFDSREMYLQGNRTHMEVRAVEWT